jgi:hypothetical protein
MNVNSRIQIMAHSREASKRGEITNCQLPRAAHDIFDKNSTAPSSTPFFLGHNAVLQHRLLVFQLLQVCLESLDVGHRGGQHRCLAGLGPLAADLFFHMGNVRNRLPKILETVVQSNPILPLDLGVRDSFDHSAVGPGCPVIFPISSLHILNGQPRQRLRAETYKRIWCAVRVFDDPVMSRRRSKAGSARVGIVLPVSRWHAGKELFFVELRGFNKFGGLAGSQRLGVNISCRMCGIPEFVNLRRSPARGARKPSAVDNGGSWGLPMAAESGHLCKVKEELEEKEASRQEATSQDILLRAQVSGAIRHSRPATYRSMSDPENVPRVPSVENAKVNAPHVKSAHSGSQWHC